MKTIYAVLIVLFLIIPPVTCVSQTCLPEGIVFTTQSQIDNFQSTYPGCTEIQGNVTITNGGISNLDGLSILTSIDSDLTVSNCQNLHNLSGLSQLYSIGGSFNFEANGLFTDINGLQSLTTIGGDFSIKNNPALLTLNGLGTLTTIGGKLFISSNGLISTIGMSSLTTIGGDLYFLNGSMQAINGFQSLVAVNGSLRFESNYVGEISLPALASVGGNLNIYNNTSLASLNGLETLTSIGGKLSIWQNVNLVDISALSNIDENTIGDLYICFNSSLSECDIRSICAYLASPNGMVTINNNMTGCNSEQEILDACAVGIDDPLLPESQVQIYPNPASDVLFIESAEKVERVSVYDSRGGQVAGWSGGLVRVEIPVSGLAPGLYLVRVETGGKVIGKKVVVR